MTEDLPPVTFGIKVTSDYGHVHFDVFAGRTPDARGRAGSLTLRRDEFEEFVRRLQPEAVRDPLGEPYPAVCCCDLIDVRVMGEGPQYVRGRPNGCRVHTSPAEAEADRAAREAARRAD